MNLIYAALITFSLPHAPGADSVAAARRIAAGVQLAAEEDRNGVSGGKVTARSEVAEAQMFLEVARRAATDLSPRLAAATIVDIDRVLTLIASVADPDSVTASAHRTVADLSKAMGVALDEIPDRAPQLTRGADLYKRECSSCHGMSGRARTRHVLSDSTDQTLPSSPGHD